MIDQALPAPADAGLQQAAPETPSVTPAPTPSEVAGLAEGRIVHYHAQGASGCLAAIVVYVWRGADGQVPGDGLCNLAVFHDGTSQGLLVELASAVANGPAERERTWHWPEPA